MAKNNNLTDYLTDLANSIRSKKGTTAKINPQDFSSEISNFNLLKAQPKSVSITTNGITTIKPDNSYNGLSQVTVTTNVSSGGSATPTIVEKKDVNFYDYDGTLLYSYTWDEANSLSSLPELPTREGLTCQGWNYTLAQIKAQNGKCDIGAMYITSDGKTRLYITIAAKGRMTVPLYFSQTVANGVTIDWGDGSATQTLSGTGNKNTTHTYENVGDYVISLDVNVGCVLGLGGNIASYSIMGSNENTGKVYCNMLQKVEIGKNITSISNYTFGYCYSLSSISIPSSVTSLGIGMFYYCYSLPSISIPSSVTSLGGNMLYNCSSLSSVSIPSGVTSWGGNIFSGCSSLSYVSIPSSVTSLGMGMFNNCYSLSYVSIPSGVTSLGTSIFSGCSSLSSIYIPSSVTSIAATTFSGCYGVAFYDFSSCKSIPTLSKTSAFNGITSDCKIVVPDSLYSSWIAATNWSTYASYIVKASQFTA